MRRNARYSNYAGCSSEEALHNVKRTLLCVKAGTVVAQVHEIARAQDGRGSVRPLLPIIHVSEEVRTRFIGAVSDHIRFSGPADPYRTTMPYGGPLGATLKESLSPADLELLHNLGESGKPPAVLIKNAPIGEISSPGERDKDDVSAWFLHALGHNLGPVDLVAKGTSVQHDGKLIQTVTPSSEPTVAGSSSSSGRAPLAIHTENNYERVNGPPDALALLTIQGDTTAKTLVLPIEKIVKRLEPAVVSELKKAQYIFCSPTGEAAGAVPILGPAKRPGYARFMYKSLQAGPHLRTSDLPATKRALDLLEGVINQLIRENAHHTIALERGDVLILNNGIFKSDKPGGAMHARTGQAANSRRLSRALYFRHEMGDTARAQQENPT